MNYPSQVTQAWLDNQRSANDQRVIRVELSGCYNFRPVPVPGKRNKRYLFLYDPSTACHVLKVPETVWMADNAAMARDLMQSQSNSYSLTVLVLPAVAETKNTPAPLPSPAKAKTRARKQLSAEDAAMAVLGG